MMNFYKEKEIKHTLPEELSPDESFSFQIHNNYCVSVPFSLSILEVTYCVRSVTVSAWCTFVQRAFALPLLKAPRLPAGLPQRQVVLVVGGHPRRTHHGSHVQAERQEHAHQPDQLQRGQRGAVRRLLRLRDGRGHGGVGEARRAHGRSAGCMRGDGREGVAARERGGVRQTPLRFDARWTDAAPVGAPLPPRGGDLRRFQLTSAASQKPAGATGS